MEEQIIPELSPFNPSKHIKTYLRCHKKTPNTKETAIKTVKTKTQELKSNYLSTKNAVKYLLEGTLKRKVCRYCLTVTTPLSELDQVLQVAGKRAIYKVTIKDMLASFHPYKVTEDPNFPNKICEKCLERTISSYLFTQQCEQAERALRNCFDDMYDKSEKLDPIERQKKRGRQKLHPNYNILYTEHANVIDYAEPIINMVHTASEPLTKEDGITDLECLKCSQVLPNVESLLNHEKSHPATMWYHCRLCGKSFPKRYRLSRHMSTHKRKKSIINKMETTFTCNKCGDISRNHNKHLQHLEKHKFKTILEHLVEKKMNRLCSVCLEKSANMTDLDKELCLHGGYAELSGDRSLYSILGSTLPEPKTYKYQELMIANKVDIVRFIKRDTNISSQAETLKIPKFTISPPIIISKENIDCNHIYIYLFSEPQLVTTYVEQDISNNLELSLDDEDNIQSNCEVSEVVSRNVETVNTVLSISNCEVNNDIVKLSDKLIENNKDFMTKNIREDNFKICKLCWPFKRAVCRDCTNKISSPGVGMGSNAEILPSKACNYCWIFKHLDKCDICKKQNTSNDNIANVDEAPNPNSIKKPVRKDLCEASKDLKNMWQCSICLAKNDVDIQRCSWCESQVTFDDPISLNLKLNTEYFETNTTFAQDKRELELEICNIAEVTITSDTNSESDDMNIINNRFQTNNCFNKQTESNIINMEVENISEKISNSTTTDIHLSSSKPEFMFAIPHSEQMEIDEIKETNDFKVFDTTMYNDEPHLIPCRPLQFHIGIGSEHKSKVKKRIKHISWSRK